ncbi:MAG: amino acid permease [Bacteroidetes bacterium]|nr:MAG: amino acid permease [Bacteroidota bacterium]
MSAELKRSLTLYGLVMIAVGSTIGSGIFRTPGQIVAQVHLPEYVIALWVLGGVVALTGALTYAEMGSMFPGAGGLYVYLREAYGDTIGFLYGWFILFISTSGSIAALAVVCAEHLLYLYGGPDSAGMVVPLAVGITVFLTVINLFGVKIGEWIANMFTGAKLLGMLLIIGAGLFFARPEFTASNADSAFANTAPADLSTAFAIAFVGVLWSIGGWQHASYVAGEARNPQRNVPRAMILGALIVTLVYVLANVAYMRLLPMEQIADSKTIAADAFGNLAPWGGTLMAFLIALSTFGTTGIYCMTAPRIYYAMANDGVFFKKLAEVHPRWRTPVNAILIQSTWSLILLLFWGTFEDLIEYVTFMDWIGLMLTGTAIFIFRWKRPEAMRGYRTLGYPFTPIIFVGICLWFISYTLVENPVKAFAGFTVAFVGWVAYQFYFKKHRD